MLQVFLERKYLGRGTDKKVLLQELSPNIHIYLTDYFSHLIYIGPCIIVIVEE